MSKPSPARYRTTHGSNYIASLKKRGCLLIRFPAIAACSDERVAGQGDDLARAT